MNEQEEATAELLALLDLLEAEPLGVRRVFFIGRVRSYHDLRQHPRWQAWLARRASPFEHAFGPADLRLLALWCPPYSREDRAVALVYGILPLLEQGPGIWVERGRGQWQRIRGAGAAPPV